MLFIADATTLHCRENDSKSVQQNMFSSSNVEEGYDEGTFH